MAAVTDPSALPRIEQAYRVLGLTPDSSALRMKREYRRLAKLWHPDKFPPNTAEQRRATERMREINDAYQLIRHAPLRYRADVSPRVDKPTVVVRRTEPVTDRLEYVVRFVAGFMFGAFVGIVFILADLPIGIVVAIPFATGTASAIFGDDFWYWILKHWWLWSP